MGKASKKKHAEDPSLAKAEHKTKEISNFRSQTYGADSKMGTGVFYKPIFHLLLIAVIGFLAYSNTFYSPFQWDEAEYILRNPIVRDLGYFSDLSRLEGSWLHQIIKSRYVGYLTFALNYRFHGFDVFGYHVVNLAIHLINAVLVYFLILLTFRTPYFNTRRSAISSQPAAERLETQSPATSHQSRITAFIVALLFVSHPIQTEAVTYVFQRLASLVSMFYLLSVVLYIKGRQIQVEVKAKREQVKAEAKAKAGKILASTSTCFILSLLSAVLAMKTKENAFTLPVVITMYEVMFFSGPMKQRILRLIPFLLTMLIIPLTIFGSGSSAGEVMSQIKDPALLGYEQLSRDTYLFTQFRVIVTYIRLLFIPINQTIDYAYPIYRSFLELPVFLSFLFLSTIFAGALYLVYKTRAISGQQSAVSSLQAEKHSIFHFYRLTAFGILWFFITLSVESGIIPIPMVIDEYRIYLPSVGFFIALVSVIKIFLEQSSRFALYVSRFAKIAAVAFTVLVGALGSATYARNIVWESKISLWEDVVQKNPTSPRGYNNLGIAYFEKGMYDKAIAAYEKCIVLSPSYRTVYTNLGVVYANTGRLAPAIDNFAKSISLDPENVAGYINLARAYSDVGRIDKAAENYRKATELNPYNSGAYHGLGTAYVRMGRLDDALAAYSQFVMLSPRDPEAYRNRGIVYEEKGEIGNARADFQISCSLGSSESCEYLKDPQFR